MGDDVRVADALLLDGLVRPFLVAMTSSSKNGDCSKAGSSADNYQMSSYPPYPILDNGAYRGIGVPP